MDDFFENLNDNLEDRAAFMGTVGAISALKNQGRQIGKLDELKEAHEKGNIIEKERLEIAEKMVLGREADFGSYQKDVGIAEGLQRSADLIDETFKNFNQGDE